jgi:uncharacterized membrane protein
VRTAVTVEHEVEIRRARNDVFTFLSDRERLPGWSAGIKRVRRTSPGWGVGTTYVVIGMVLGRRIQSSYEVTVYEPDLAFAGRMTSPAFDVEERYRFEDAPGSGSTRVHVRVEALPRGRLRLLGPLMGPALQRQVHIDHRRLKTSLERSRPRHAEPAPDGPDGPDAPDAPEAPHPAESTEDRVTGR